MSSRPDLYPPYPGKISETKGTMSAPSGADVLIVIPSLNEAAHIESVVRSLQADTNCRDALIVVADGRSTDQTVAIVERMGQDDPRVRVLATNQPLGISASVNRAVQKFGHRRSWLVRIDAHAEYPPCYSSRLVAKAVEMGASSVVTPMITKGSTCFQKAAAAAQNSFLGTGGARHRMVLGSGWVEHGHHALMDLKLFTLVGGYDESFSHNEDAELDCRITKSGGKIWLADDLALTYFPRGSTRRLFKQYFQYGRGRAMTIQRHGGKVRRPRQLLPLAVAPAVILSLFFPISHYALLPAGIWMTVCLLYGLALGVKLGICAAASGYAAMVMQLAWSMGYWRHILSGERTQPPPKPLDLAGAGTAAVVG
jgi:succinoglycan biosynthesis protein ExoA